MFDRWFGQWLNKEGSQLNHDYSVFSVSFDRVTQAGTQGQAPYFGVFCRGSYKSCNIIMHYVLIFNIIVAQELLPYHKLMSAVSIWTSNIKVMTLWMLCQTMVTALINAVP